MRFFTVIASLVLAGAVPVVGADDHKAPRPDPFTDIDPALRRATPTAPYRLLRNLRDYFRPVLDRPARNLAGVAIKKQRIIWSQLISLRGPPFNASTHVVLRRVGSGYKPASSLLCSRDGQPKFAAGRDYRNSNFRQDIATWPSVLHPIAEM